MAMEREISILVFQQFSRLGPWIRIFFDLKNHCLAAARGIEDNIQMLGFYSEEKPYIDLVPWLGLKRNLKGKSWEIIKGHRKSWCHVWMEKNAQCFKGKQLFGTLFGIWIHGTQHCPMPLCWSTEHLSPNAGADVSEGIRPDFPGPLTGWHRRTLNGWPRHAKTAPG